MTIGEQNAKCKTTTEFMIEPVFGFKCVKLAQRLPLKELNYSWLSVGKRSACSQVLKHNQTWQNGWQKDDFGDDFPYFRVSIFIFLLSIYPLIFYRLTPGATHGQRAILIQTGGLMKSLAVHEAGCQNDYVLLISHFLGRVNED